ncbi:MAG: Holliday junction branch migration protein RuvA [Candidatus Marinimicrobia bacterium]|nr:Holliday junction branch migration protein RuvA [Candidatus Neomarinimicrobiota bacterium]
MIVHLSGKLAEKHPNHIVVDVHGVGYRVWITLNTYEGLPDQGHEVSLLTHHQVREDGQDLFGFDTAEERDVFGQLIGISGIGAKTAVSILSGARYDDFRRRVQEGNEDSLKAIKGVGPKMARRIITELREVFGGGAEWASNLAAAGGPGGDSETVSQAVQSLITLGYKPHDAWKAVKSALKSTSEDAPVEELIRAALSGK